MPTSTDLVTDLPADFETFGQAVATSMADLLGGTTGQVLSKASNTDMDFTWVAQDDSNAIQNAIVDAKGDLIAASAADTPARLAVGNNGETLVADSSTSTGLRYQAPVNVNPVLNSAFQIWQRGTSIACTTTSTYTADRFYGFRGGVVAGQTVSRQATNDTTNLPFIQYCARVQRDSGNTSTQGLNLLQDFESVNSIPYAGRTITFSFYARAGANYSPAGNGLTGILLSGTGTDQTIRGGYTGSATVVSVGATLTTTWQRFQGTATVSSSATQLGFYFTNTPVGTAGANDWFEVTGIQLEVGSVATPFKTYAGTIQGELAACQRYYWRQTASGANNCFINAGKTSSTTAVNMFLALPVTMRITPTVLDYSGGAIDDTGGAYGFSALVIGAGGSGTNTVQLNATVTGATSGRYATLRANGGSDYLGLGAEL
jgi:hypothetical protein